MSPRRPATAARLATSLLAAVALVAVATPIGAQSASAESSPGGVEVERYGGADRYATSLEVAQAVLDDAGGTTEWAVMVSGTSWPDAVVAASLAGALDAPVLLTPRDELLTDTGEFLAAASIGNVIVVGSSASPGISNSVVSELESEGYAVERISGSSRSETSVAVARHLGTVRQSDSGSVSAVGSMPGFGTTAIVTSSEIFADALVSGPVSAYGGHPVLLTSPHGLDAHVADYLTEAGVEHVVLMGGTAALSAPVHQALVERGLAVTRLSGATRFETAVLMAELVHERYADSDGRACFSHAEVGLARARVPFDSFSAAPLLARRCASLLLTDPTKADSATETHLNTVASDAASSGTGKLRVHVFGGNLAVSNAALRLYFGADTRADEPEPEPEPSPGICGDSGGTRRHLTNAQPLYYAWWTRDCSRMAYLIPFGALWVANGDGTAAVELVPDSRRVGWHAWSPDGSQIAFSAATGHGNDAVRHIYVMNADGTRERQVTSGEVNDDDPSWSADGRRLVLRRRNGAGRDSTPIAYEQDMFLVTIDADGSNERAHLVGGTHEERPTWSPDGRHIAYGSLGTIWVMTADGTLPIAVTRGITGRGAQWSPDSKRLVVSRNLTSATERTADAVVVDLEGFTEHRLPIDPDLLAHHFYPNAAPQWSPDGRRVFFHLSAKDPFVQRGDAENWIHVLEAPAISVPLERTCRLDARPGAHTVGFPLPDWARESTGTLRVAVLFVDFPDAIPTHSTFEESDSSLAYFEQYLEASSGGRLDIELVPHHVWLRAEHDVEHFVNERFRSGLLDEMISDHAIQLADDNFDFSDIDVVLTVMPSTLFGGGGNEGFNVSADGNVMRAIRMNHGYRQGSYSTWPGSDERHPTINPWGRTAAHELLHSLGLRDLYWEHTLGFRLWPIGDPLAPPQLPEGERWALIEFGMMQLNGYDRVVGGNLKDRRLEMLAWSKWQLGWLDRQQVECIAADSAQVWLSPAAEPHGGTAMAAVQLSANAAIVVESRRLVGYDEPSSFTREQVVAGERDPQYLAEGVLVYTVNSLRGEHPVSLAQDNGRGYLRDFPLLGIGDSVSVFGYTITVVEDTGSEHLVSIRKDD